VRLTPRGKRTADAVALEWSQAYTLLLDRVPRGDRQRIAEALDALARLLEGDPG